MLEEGWLYGWENRTLTHHKVPQCHADPTLAQTTCWVSHRQHDAITATAKDVDQPHDVGAQRRRGRQQGHSLDTEWQHCHQQQPPSPSQCIMWRIVKATAPTRTRRVDSGPALGTLHCRTSLPTATSPTLQLHPGGSCGREGRGSEGLGRHANQETHRKEGIQKRKGGQYGVAAASAGGDRNRRVRHPAPARSPAPDRSKPRSPVRSLASSILASSLALPLPLLMPLPPSQPTAPPHQARGKHTPPATREG